MDSISANSAVQGNTPNFAFNSGSAIGAEDDDQGDLFSAALSQAQSAPLQPPAPQTAQQSSPPSQPVQQPLQNNTANSTNGANNADSADDANNTNAGDTNNANATGNASASSNPTENSSVPSNSTAAGGTNASSGATNSDGDPKHSNADASSPAASQTPAAKVLVNGKFSRRQSKTGTDNTNTPANAGVGNKPGKSPVTATVAGNLTAANNVVSNPTTTNATAPSSDPADTDSNAAPVTGADKTAPANPVSNAGSGLVTNDATGNITASNANTAATLPTPDTNPTTNTDPAANTSPAVSSASAVNAALIVNADPATGSTTNPVGNNGNSNVDPTTPISDTANNDVMPSHLMMLLMQLEHLAATQNDPAVARNAPANSPTVNSNAQTFDPSGTQQTTAPTGDQGKTDLKALMTEIARLGSGVGNSENSDLQNGDDTANASPNAPPSVTTTTSSQNAAPTWGNGSSSTDTKWISPNFLNLFSLPASNPVNSNVSSASPILFNAGLITQTTTDGNDGTALDSDTQGQTNAGARDTALLSNTASLPPATGLTQAASPYDFASQLSALRATQGGSTGLPPPVDQVILQLSRNLTKDGSSQMSIQLRPAELGRVDVKLTIGSDGKVQGTVTADNPNTLNLLLKDVRGLERALQEAGLRADSGSLQFGLRGDGQAGGNSGQTAGNSSALADDSVSSSGTTTILPGFADPAEIYYLTPGGVNMRV